MGQTIPYSAIQVLLQKVLSLITFEADTASSKTGSMSSIGSLSPANDIQYFHSHEFRRRSTDVCQNAKLRNLLMDIGEDPAYVDLLNELLFGVRKNAGVASQAQAQYLTVGSTAGGVGVRPSKIQLLDAEGKRMVMKSVVTRMMAHVLGTKKVALILDDAQWIDPTSIDVICGVIETCKNLFLVSFSRPLMDDNRIKGMAYDQKYMLTGLRYIEIEKCLVERLRLGVKITPKLVKLLWSTRAGTFSRWTLL
ncbi:hypothetical protein BC829DRAFT_296300 [Chytridium lagenaria]|nr:hypothetical protein BC829DRAFT_296300 [Chytridium lagenaria]